MTSTRPGLIFLNLFRSAIKFYSLLYYGFITLYCFTLVFDSVENVPSIALAPFVYSIIVPILILLSLPLLYLLMFYLFKDKLFIKRFVVIVAAIMMIAFLVISLVSLLQIRLPDQFEVLKSIGEIYKSEKGDIVFVVLTLLDVAFLSFFSVKDELREIEFIDSMFRQIAFIGFIGFILFIASAVLALSLTVYAGLFIPDHPKIIVLFLLAYYLINTYIRGRMHRKEKESYSKETLEENLSER
jgi:hypothetical protein